MSVILAKIGKGDAIPSPWGTVLAFGLPLLFCLIRFFLRRRQRFKFSLGALLAFVLTLSTCLFIQTQLLPFERWIHEWELGMSPPLFAPESAGYFPGHFSLALLWTGTGFLVPENFRALQGKEGASVPSRLWYFVSAFVAFAGASLSLFLIVMDLATTIM
jgi:hypothetical protein